MHSFGIRQNDVVGIMSENRLEFPAIAFAAIYLGAIVTPINITYTNRKKFLILNEKSKIIKQFLKINNQ